MTPTSSRTLTIACAISLLPPYLQRAAHEELVSHRTLETVAEHPQLKPSLVSRYTQASEMLERSEKLGVTAIPIGSKEYPASLQYLHIPPAILFLKSIAPRSLASISAIAVVGSRSATLPVCSHTSTVAAQLADQGVVVVSGLALGVDGAAHRGAIRSSSPFPTIAVLANGLDSIYPTSHTQLAAELLNRGGILLSEYPPGTPPLRHHFLARNRIIAALAHTTVVVQASARSGSLVTAQSALDLGREVVVLHDNVEPLAEGCVKLISEGALSACTSDDILKISGIAHCAPPSGEEKQSSFVPFDTTILPLAELLRITHFSLSYITQLELDGSLHRLPGNRISISKALLTHLVDFPPSRTEMQEVS